LLIATIGQNAVSRTTSKSLAPIGLNHRSLCRACWHKWLALKDAIIDLQYSIVATAVASFSSTNQKIARHPKRAN
jgi:hypothetical protein